MRQAASRTAMNTAGKMAMAAIAALVWLGHAHALQNGRNDVDTPDANAAVRVDGGSGTLIAPNLVLTNGHVSQIPLPNESPPFSLTNSSYPDRWYPAQANEAYVSVGPAAYGQQGVAADGRHLTWRTRLFVMKADPTQPALRSGEEIGLRLLSDHYLYVDQGRAGGNVLVDVIPNRYAAWQKFFVDRVEGAGNVRHGDRVTLRIADGARIARIAPVSRRNPVLQADRVPLGQRHEFVVRRARGTGVVRHNDVVTLRALGNGGRFVQFQYIVTPYQVATPGMSDMALLRLRSPIPADIARPIPVMTAIPRRVASLPQYLANRTFRVAGYGQLGNGSPAPMRQVGQFRNVRNAGFVDQFDADGVAGEGTRCGDSGSGWISTAPNGRRYLFGLTWQGGCGALRFRGGRFLATLSPGGSSSGGSHPDIGAWFRYHLRQDDCVPVTRSDLYGRFSALYRSLGARRECRFGGPETYAVSLIGGRNDGRDCVRFNAGNLTLRRGRERWTVHDGRHAVLQVPGTWQQSYTRGVYLIDYLKRASRSKICFSNRPNPQLVYFR